MAARDAPVARALHFEHIVGEIGEVDSSNTRKNSARVGQFLESVRVCTTRGCVDALAVRSQVMRSITHPGRQTTVVPVLVFDERGTGADVERVQHPALTYDALAIAAHSCQDSAQRIDERLQTRVVDHRAAQRSSHRSGHDSGSRGALRDQTCCASDVERDRQADQLRSAVRSRAHAVAKSGEPQRRVPVGVVRPGGSRRVVVAARERGLQRRRGVESLRVPTRLASARPIEASWITAATLRQAGPARSTRCRDSWQTV